VDGQELPSLAALRVLVISALEGAGGEATNAQIRSRVEQRGAFTPEQLARRHGSGRGSELHYRIRWALVDLRRRGSIERRGPGVWAISTATRGE
jgi:restriction endonuclease Mrr